MLWSVVLLLLVVWCLLRRWRMRHQRALAGVLRSNLTTWPLLGHSYRLLGSDTDRMRFLEELGRDALEQGGVSKFMHFDQLFLCVAEPAVAEILLRECLDKHQVMNVLKVLIGNGSIIAPVPIWRPRRKSILPTFSTQNLVHFAGIFAKNAASAAALLEREVDSGAFSLWDYISVYAFNNICESTIGVDMRSEGGHFMSAVNELWELGGHVIVRPWYACPLLQRFLPGLHTNRDIVWQFVNKVIKEKKEAIEKSKYETSFKEDKVDPPCFLGRQVQGARLAGAALAEECLTLLVAGFDTSATLASFAGALLARHTHIQDKVYRELQAVFGESDRAVCYEDLPRLEYLDAVVRETLRLYPVVPIVVRRVDRDIQLPCGLSAVKGCGVLVNIWALHRNPQYWGPDADTFRPERFLDSSLKHPAAFMAFSYGTRNCLGYRYALVSVKTLLATLFRRYRLQAAGAGGGGARGELCTAYNILLKHADNYTVTIHRRT